MGIGVAVDVDVGVVGEELLACCGVSPLLFSMAAVAVTTPLY